MMIQKQDRLVPKAGFGNLDTYFRKLGANVNYVEIDGTHIMPSISKGSNYNFSTLFTSLLPRDVNKYDGAGEFLKFTYKNIKPRTDDWRKHGDFIVVSQKSYQFGEKHGLSDKMFLYLPKNCSKGGCRAHIMLHGCLQTHRKAGMLFAKRSGFLEYAATNEIVVIFPNTDDDAHAHCWDG